MQTIEIGQTLPSLPLQTSQGTKNLTDWKNKNVVLYFYPKDDTPGCTIEAQDFRDHIKQFDKANTVIVGVSRDNLACHDKFITKFSLPFILVSDEQEELCQLFDVIKMKNMYGKQCRGIERSTFLIDKNGVLQREWRKVKVENHAQEVLEAVKKLS